ncbi:MAG: GNAT family N-acetyltransferase, partial [Jatrophihabitantaceae bacterium]
MNLRAATSEDQSGVEEVVAAAFDEPVDGGVVRMMRLLTSSGAERASIIAVAEDEVVGHVQLSRGWIDAREALVEALVLSPLSVTPTRQNRGIGTALVEAALAEAERQGSPAVFLEGSPTYYGRRGFQAATPKGLSRPSPRIPDRGWQVALLPAHETWMTGQVVYPDAFWVTDKVGLRDPELRQV